MLKVLKLAELRTYCESGCDCPTCHLGIGEPYNTEVEKCYYCQKKWKDKGQYAPNYWNKQNKQPMKKVLKKDYRFETPESKEELSKFGVINKMAKYGGYTVDDALFMYGVFALINDGFTEDDADEVFKKTK